MMKSSLCVIWKIIKFFIFTLFFLAQDITLAASLHSTDSSFENERRKIIVAALNELSTSTINQEGLQKKAAQVEKTREGLTERQKEIGEMLDQASRNLAKRKEISLPKVKPKKIIDWKMSGEWLNRFYYDAVENNPWEDVYSAHSWLNLENKIRLPQQDIFIFTSSDIRYDLTGDGKRDWDIDTLLQKAYLEIRKRKFSFSIGRQTVTWGKLDDVPILDIVNPQDYNEFILLDKQQRKMPLFMTKLDYFWSGNHIEGIFIPRFKPDRMKFFGSDWAVFDHLKEIIEKGSYTAAVKDIGRAIKIEEQDISTRNTFSNGELGLKFRNKASDVDYTLYYMYVHSRVPVLREKTPNGNILKRFLYTPTTNSLSKLVALNSSGEDLVLEKEYPRMNVIGGDFETVIGEYGLRGECGLFLGAPYLRSDFSYVRKDRLSLGLGVDRTIFGNFYYNLQFIEDVILDYEELFAQEEYSHQITLNLKQDFLRGNLLLALDCSYNLSYGDSMLNPEVRYKFNGGIEAALGSFIFGGDSTTLFGRYSAKDVVYMEMKYSF